MEALLTALGLHVCLGLPSALRWGSVWHEVGKGWVTIDSGFFGDSAVKNPPANTGDLGSIPELGRSPGCGRSPKRRGSLRFLPPLEVRPSCIIPHPVESLEAPPNSTVSVSSQRHPEQLPEVTGTSRGNTGYPAATRERPQESVFNAS